MDDVGFIDAVVSHLKGRVPSPSKVFITGLSNGGGMTIRYTIEKGGNISGAAPSLMSKATGLPAPSTAVPLFFYFGHMDPLVPYGGGEVSKKGCGGSPILESLGAVLSFPNTVQEFLDRNGGCPGYYTPSFSGPWGPKTYYYAYFCSGGPTINVVLGLGGPGHRYPGVDPDPNTCKDDPDRGSIQVGEPNTDFDIVGTTLNFFDGL